MLLPLSRFCWQLCSIDCNNDICRLQDIEDKLDQLRLAETSLLLSLPALPRSHSPPVPQPALTDLESGDGEEDWFKIVVKGKDLSQIVVAEEEEDRFDTPEDEDRIESLGEEDRIRFCWRCHRAGHENHECETEVNNIMEITFTFSLVLNFVEFFTSQTFQVIWESIPYDLHWCKTGREFLKDNPEAA